MKLALITDAWLPQTNGVVTTLRAVCNELNAIGHSVETFTPDLFRNWPCPGYPEIRLALGCGPKLRTRLDRFEPDAIHIATEGPLGLTARRYCKQRGLPFTSSFHTRFAEYIHLRTGLPLSVGYAYLRWFHSESVRVMAATPALLEELKARGFKNPVLWSRGVDTELFRPRSKDFLPDAHPVMLYVGRVAIEKNIEAFLELDIPGTKYVVGDGPQRQELERKYPEVHFVGYKYGEELARYLAAADVFVFPSRTDTFGLVMLEALASGVPVAAFPVEGPKDVILSRRVGCLDEDLKKAITEALQLDPEDCRRYALQYSWRDCALQFERYLARIPKNGPRSAAWWQRSS
ncbi:glycosyltransferase family 4 protein [Methylocaldum szegediense]|uniref:glycosyltransferase family 4 protein n=1 Tax=Methylocaldum szegediense TaxID=73780 RepID=UPI000407E3D2|nr:glycosyltransferase family 1 protein [Methylocaldum szegediense]